MVEPQQVVKDCLVCIKNPFCQRGPLQRVLRRFSVRLRLPLISPKDAYAGLLWHAPAFLGAAFPGKSRIWKKQVVPDQSGQDTLKRPSMAFHAFLRDFLTLNRFHHLLWLYQNHQYS